MACPPGTKKVCHCKTYAKVRKGTVKRVVAKLEKARQKRMKLKKIEDQLMAALPGSVRPKRK